MSKQNLLHFTPYQRLLATLNCDARLQFRNGFYYASLVVLITLALLVSRAPALDVHWLLPALLLGNLVMGSFYFVAGLVLLEKGENTLEAQTVTPLRIAEYLGSKILTLAFLALAENLVLTILINGLHFDILPLLLGLVLASALLTLGGFLSVARYQSINEFLIPSILYTTILIAPMIAYLAGWESWLFYLHPLQAPLVLLRGAWQPLTAGQWAYGVLYSILWIDVFFHLSERVFNRFIVTRQGAE
jgi:fluoroquinolone transport system permease protein